MIGAGGVVFPLRLMGDLLSFPALRGATYALMDLSLERAERTATAARELAAHYGFPATITATDDQRAALDGADYVIVTFQVGGARCLPRTMSRFRGRYGLDQPVGDTLGPGGVFRFLRSAPAYAQIASDMRELCPDALLINYANPMAMNCWSWPSSGSSRSVSATACREPRGCWRGTSACRIEEVEFRVGGINHQAWFTEFRRGDEDLYPRLREVMAHRHLAGTISGGLAMDTGRPQRCRPRRFRLRRRRGAGPHLDHGGVRLLPHRIQPPRQRVRALVPQGRRAGRCVHSEALGLLRALARRGSPRTPTAKLLAELKEELKPSLEYGAMIVNAMETGEPVVIHGNVPNHGLIDNLPDGCCVEVACLVDRNGVQPTHLGALPPQCAAVNQTNINVQQSGGAGRPDRETGACLSRDHARSADWRPAHARPDPGDDRRTVRCRGGMAAPVSA